ncbi:hypothetical protein Srot_1942 [Segniliparus rotundus DSM 44985]|uniref:Uncharacterized protein n=1 Tax=Segniliparus rotundus (strain ATCC BAA-972 / CDC 1076 / CIP 108378 / DSM 44985 / JCM 13578) TaxID=640132 RepID=D6Z8W9_SEGRD|nr:hypothetical protein [Segniliparus rotundus]ADG98399.1 hypothetical protein Srot_1942 [Segniliparus rotundus DSM 44985]
MRELAERITLAHMTDLIVSSLAVSCLMGCGTGSAAPTAVPVSSAEGVAGQVVEFSVTAEPAAHAVISWGVYNNSETPAQKVLEACGDTGGPTDRPLPFHASCAAQKGSQLASVTATWVSASGDLPKLHCSIKVGGKTLTEADSPQQGAGSGGFASTNVACTHRLAWKLPPR